MVAYIIKSPADSLDMSVLRHNCLFYTHGIESLKIPEKPQWWLYSQF